MKITLFRLLSGLAVISGLLPGCATRVDREDPGREYLAFLPEHPGADLSGNKEKAAVADFKKYLSAFIRDSVRRDTPRVDAPDAWLNDTLKTVRGSKAIEEYFLGSVAKTGEIKVVFTDVARSGNDYYFRWVMDVKFKKFQRGKTIRTIGITHVRFNRDGQVLLHQDYWDSARGLFEYVPVIGGGIRFIKSRL